MLVKKFKIQPKLSLATLVVASDICVKSIKTSTNETSWVSRYREKERKEFSLYSQARCVVFWTTRYLRFNQLKAPPQCLSPFLSRWRDYTGWAAPQTQKSSANEKHNTPHTHFRTLVSHIPFAPPPLSASYNLSLNIVSQFTFRTHTMYMIGLKKSGNILSISFDFLDNLW